MQDQPFRATALLQSCKIKNLKNITVQTHFKVNCFRCKNIKTNLLVFWNFLQTTVGENTKKFEPWQSLYRTSNCVTRAGVITFLDKLAQM